MGDFKANKLQNSSSNLKHGWDELYDAVTRNYADSVPIISSSESGSKDASVKGLDSEQTPSLTSRVCRDALISRGLRPKSDILNLLLDAISLKLAELEKQAKSQIMRSEAESTNDNEPVNSNPLAKRFSGTNPIPDAPKNNYSITQKPNCVRNETTRSSSDQQVRPIQQVLKSNISKQTSERATLNPGFPLSIRKNEVWVNPDIRIPVSSRSKPRARSNKNQVSGNQRTFESLKGLNFTKLNKAIPVDKTSELCQSGRMKNQDILRSTKTDIEGFPCSSTSVSDVVLDVSPAEANSTPPATSVLKLQTVKEKSVLPHCTSSKKPKFESCTYDDDEDDEIIRHFNRIPARESRGPNFKYKEKTARKKTERSNLMGWDCKECRPYYELLQSQIDEEEIAKIINKCSKHRSKSPVVQNTPVGFWNTEIPSTQQLYTEGHIRVSSVSFIPSDLTRKKLNHDGNN